MDDISLGALEQDAGAESPETNPDPNLPPLGMPDAGGARDPREEMEREEEEERRAMLRDAGSLVDASVMADASLVLDATVADASTVDAALLDAGHDAGTDAGGDAALEEDSGPLDAGSDAQRSLLCTLEPWHCL